MNVYNENFLVVLLGLNKSDVDVDGELFHYLRTNCSEVCQCCKSERCDGDEYY